MNLSQILDAIEWYGTNPEEQPYDFGAIVQMLAACLDNLRTHGLEAEIEDIGDYLENEQKAFLARLASACVKNM